MMDTTVNWDQELQNDWISVAGLFDESEDSNDIRLAKVGNGLTARGGWINDWIERAKKKTAGVVVPTLPAGFKECALKNPKVTLKFIQGITDANITRSQFVAMKTITQGQWNEILTKVASNSIVQENFDGYVKGNVEAKQKTDSTIKKICETVIEGSAAAGAVGAAMIMIGLAIMAIAAAGAPETLGASAIMLLPGFEIMIVGIVISGIAGLYAVVATLILTWFG